MKIGKKEFMKNDFTEVSFVSSRSYYASATDEKLKSTISLPHRLQTIHHKVGFP